MSATSINPAWKAVVYTEGKTPCGMSEGIPEVLPELYDTAEAAQAAALAAMAERPELYCSHVRLAVKPNPAPSHAQQAQAAIKDEARKSSPRPKEPPCTR